MTREDVLQLLGLETTVTPADVEQALLDRVTQLESRIGAAPTDALKDKYRRQLQDLEAARAALLEGPVQPGLSQTQLADLPLAQASYTRSATGVSAGTRYFDLIGLRVACNPARNRDRLRMVKGRRRSAVRYLHRLPSPSGRGAGGEGLNLPRLRPHVDRPCRHPSAGRERSRRPDPQRGPACRPRHMVDRSRAAPICPNIANSTGFAPSFSIPNAR